MSNLITYLSRNQLDKKRWDEWMNSSANRRIYGTSLFLDIFCPQWEALVLGDGQACMPVTRNRKYGISYLFQPLFVQQLGCFFSGGSCSDALPVFMENLSSRFRFIDISLNENNHLQHKGFQVSNMDNYLLSLDMPYESLAKRYSSNTGRNIIKAGRHGTDLLPYYSPPEIISLFRNNAGRIYPGIRRINYKQLESLLQKGVAEGFIQVRAARAVNGKIIAAACFLKDFDRYVFYFSANTEEGRKQGAMFFIIDNFIRQHSGSGMVLDFNGSMNPGMARFYRGFGTEKRIYQRIRVNRLPFPFNRFRQ